MITHRSWTDHSNNPRRGLLLLDNHHISVRGLKNEQHISINQELVRNRATFCFGLEVTGYNNAVSFFHDNSLLPDLILAQAVVDGMEEVEQDCTVVLGHIVVPGYTVVQVGTGAQYTEVRVDTGPRACLGHIVHQRHIVDQVGILKSQVQMCLSVPERLQDRPLTLRFNIKEEQTCN